MEDLNDYAKFFETQKESKPEKEQSKQPAGENQFKYYTYKDQGVFSCRKIKKIYTYELHNKYGDIFEIKIEKHPSTEFLQLDLHRKLSELVKDANAAKDDNKKVKKYGVAKDDNVCLLAVHEAVQKAIPKELDKNLIHFAIQSPLEGAVKHTILEGSYESTSPEGTILRDILTLRDASGIIYEIMIDNNAQLASTIEKHLNQLKPTETSLKAINTIIRNLTNESQQEAIQIKAMRADQKM